MTLARSVLVGVVAVLALAGDFAARVPILVAVASVALLLDGVDGWVARRTGTASAFGARFDLEVDAFLILVLSLYVAPATGWWVLLIGLARYAFVAAGRALPWLRGTAPPRPWCKVVAVVQGVVLTVAAAGLVPAGWMRLALAVALVLLAESFGRESWELWKLQGGDASSAIRGVRSTAATVLALVVVWFVLVLPEKVTHLTSGAFVRVPVEGLVLVALALVLGRRAARAVTVAFGLLLGLVLVLKVLDLGFSSVLDRTFDPLNDSYYLGPAVGVLADSIGRPAALAVAAGTGLLVIGVVAGVCLAVVRLAHAARRHEAVSRRAVVALAVAWGLAAATGLQVASGPVASAGAADLAFGQVHQLRADFADRKVFDKEIATDGFAIRLAATPPDQRLAGLRGKDVLVVFVESFGRSAVEGSSYSPGVDAVLDDGTRRLKAAGYSTRSAFLTSPTFGAGSWLAHSSLQSGLWVDSQQRYNQLITDKRLTLTRAFGDAGWRTVFNDPAITHDWTDGERFYGFDKSYDSRNVGYRGPQFGYAPIPDQYSLDALTRYELTADPARPRVMGEIDLVSSHHPWTPLPHLVDWDALGDGSVFDGMPAQGESEATVYRDPAKVRALYGQSIQYTMGALVSWLERRPDPNLVLVVLGDHEPHHYVSGRTPGHDVPVVVIASDPSVTDRVAGWGWQDGLHPASDAPVWRMDSFRDRFLGAFAQ
ncbi:CDP-alcohol phosphatidyltransferase family protein [Marmoricola sp. URHA0025 HA25]